jgi:hypothetical protein
LLTPRSWAWSTAFRDRKWAWKSGLPMLASAPSARLRAAASDPLQVVACRDFGKTSDRHISPGLLHRYYIVTTSWYMATQWL